MARAVCEEKSREMVSSSGGFCYSGTTMEGLVGDPADMFNNLTSGMDMVGFSKNVDSNNPHMWKALFGKQGPSSRSINNDSSSASFYQQQQVDDDSSWQENRLVVDDSSLRCVFPCEGNERPSQGLSLSLSSTNPSSIGLQSFELRQTTHPQSQPYYAYQNFANNNNKAAASSSSTSAYQGHLMLKNSKYLVPAQDLLNEFCSLAIKHKSNNNNHQHWEDHDSSKKPSPTSIEFLELQKRKTKLLSMLEEVDRRYKNYRIQMKAVVSSFEAVAGNGAATVYTALAQKAMSKYFRNLKDAIMGQIQATRKAMGEKDPVAPGTTKGETPRLKIIDQALRQQRAFQQMSMMETHPWRPQRGLPERSVSVLRAWLFEHFLHPYPSDVDKHILARQTGLSRSQVSNWFINARVRLWKPMVEEMYMEELKEQENMMASSEGADDPDLHLPSSRSEDQKPSVVVGMESDQCASSSMLNNIKNDPKSSHNNPEEECLGRVMDTFGSVELDFSSYTQQQQQQQQGFNGVSLTLGLQQHGGSGVSLAFPPPPVSSHHSSLFYATTRDQIMDSCPPSSSSIVHHYSLVDGEPQNLPYRNLMGAQLLHDLAG
ncbi:homeobox protein BEL1 homolog [Arachis duranensis]|uniref:Homeobox domain-containing protein n=2 Tax=Arachis TaxID=3817 RepID=A0A445D691_ARAHY|nr:homeobox protein BEL1 homolog [Arachis duranensis]XP_025699980.1 homeobox protein BEL1 homolog [Arachis hypogaea]XP_029154181.1 homeobox protein BEL1 homolog [Arachis hypogaea]XP_029154182.1 homeobox protein BEL1 homolog [Arachis hypogaea]RYR58767.1 hypothetical protein Ahy_A05g024646 [Arachis hypogaea]